MPLETLALTAAILFTASLVQGVTGFGFGITAMALLPMVMNLQEATLLVAVLGLAVNLLSLIHYRASRNWRIGWPLMLGAAIGSPIGVYFLHQLNEDLMVRTLGALIAGFSARELFWTGSAERPWASWTALPLGMVSGLFGAAFNIGGPPAVAYVYSQNWATELRMAVLQVLFLEIGILRVGLTATTGRLHLPLLGWCALFLVPMGLAVVLGHYLLSKIPAGRIKRPVFAVLMLMGLKYLLVGR